eukprot:11774655-Karenia_brevis.AAC.1
MWKQLALTGFQLKTQQSGTQEMDVDTPQQQPPPVSPPAQALQNTTEELKVLQKTYADLVQLSGEDSAAATHMKKMLESHSNKLTPVAVAKNHKSLLDQL